MMNLIQEQNTKIICSNCNSINNITNLNKAQNHKVKCGRCKTELEIPKIKNEEEVMVSFEHSINYIKELFQSFYDASVDYIGQEKRSEYSNKIRDLEKKISSLKRDELPLILVVAGEYSSGKSSFINSLIGEDLLPADFEPITLAPSFLKYGEERKILIEFNDDNNFEEVSIEKFSSIKHSNDSLEEKYKKNIKLIHIFYPYPKLSKIHIIDTPGFSTSTKKGDNEKTMEIINQYADLLLWVFDADVNETESQVRILNRIKLLFKKNNKKNGKINDNFLNSMLKNTEKPIIGVVNKIDLKGKPNSTTVKGLVENIKKTYKLDIVIPYSSKKIIDYKKTPTMNKISSLIEGKIRSSSSLDLSLNLKEDDRGNKTISIYNLSNELISMKVDFGEIWFNLLDDLENNLNKTRNYSKEILKKSIDKEIDLISISMLNDINSILIEVKERKEKENKAFNQVIKDIEIYSKKLENIYDEYESEFKYTLSKKLAQNIFDINYNKGWVWDDQSIKLRNVNPIKLTKIINDSFNLDLLKKTETENIKNFFNNYFFNIETEREKYNINIKKTFDENIKSLDPSINKALLYLYQSNIESVSLSTIGLAKNILDKYIAIDSKKSKDRIYLDLFNHIYCDCSFNVVFKWLKFFIKEEYNSLEITFDRFNNLFQENNSNEMLLLNELKNKLTGEFK